MPSICAQCHEQGHGCCFIKENRIPEQIGLFVSDVEKISRYINKDMTYFIIQDSVTNDFREKLANIIHPIFHKIYAHNQRLRLKSTNGKCLFLLATGCQLPIEIRPVYCRAYPFWLSKDNQKIIVLSDDQCLAQKKSTLNWEVVNENFMYTEEELKLILRELVTN